MGTSNLNTEAVVVAYVAGESASVLARRYGVSVWAVLKRVRDAGVQVRSVKEQCAKHRGVPTTDAHTFQEVVEGLLLGDAYIDRKGLLHLEQSDVRFDWILQVQALFAAVGATSKIIPIPPRVRHLEGRVLRSGPAHVLYTPAYVELQAERGRWYPQGTKIVPRDLRLTPVSLTHWFCGDGTTSPRGSLAFCTNGFTQGDVGFLVSRLELDLGVTAHLSATSRPGQFQIQVDQRDQAVKVRDIVDAHITACCRYKLRHVHPTVPIQQHHQRRLTDDQVHEIRARWAKGETQVRLAAQFGVSTTAIRHIVHRKVYTWLTP